MANRRTLLVDGALRMIGAMFLGCCVSRLVRLIRLVGAPPIHDPTPAEVTIAILCVGALFAGTILTMLGHHLFDRMDIPVRHRMTAFFDPASSDEADRGALPPQLLSPRPEPPAARAARRSITAMAPIGPR